MIEFKCHTCEEIHVGMPALAWDYPLYYLSVPENEREDRCELTSDTCVVDNEFYFVRGSLEVHVHNEDEQFSWGVWVSLSKKSFARYLELYEVDPRDQEEPFFGWLSVSIAIYPETENLKTMVHLRNEGIRPFIELEPTEHPLAVEQREGITRERVAEIYEAMLH
jgi:hypothetical protein